jgi:hypothetical protein
MSLPWHKNPRHLLFYLRLPALQARSITVNNDGDAQTLLKWLLPILPL